MRWDGLRRLVVAWKAVRLDPDYRKDWAEHRRYIEWWHSMRPDQKMTEPALNGPVWLWLHNLMAKWGFDPAGPFDPSWPDPSVEIPLYSRRQFRRCLSHCRKPWKSEHAFIEKQRTPFTQWHEWKCTRAHRGGGPVSSCLWAYFALFRRACPFRNQELCHISPIWPGAHMDKDDPGWKSAPHKGLAFHGRESRRGSRAVFWVLPSSPRYGLRNQLIVMIDTQASLRQRGGKAVWDGKSKGRAIHLIEDGGWLVISTDLRVSRQRFESELDAALRRIERSPYATSVHLDALWEALRYYERIHYGGETIETICKRRWKDGAARWQEHLRLRRRGKWYAPVRRIHDAYTRADAFVRTKGYRGLIQPGYREGEWNPFVGSPMEPPPIPQSGSPENVSSPQGRIPEKS